MYEVFWVITDILLIITKILLKQITVLNPNHPEPSFELQ